jgi:hypothetical protein
MEEFISKWSNFWAFQPNKEQLNKAFENELRELIYLKYRAQTDLIYEKIFDIITDLLRDDIDKWESIEDIMDVWNDR